MPLTSPTINDIQYLAEEVRALAAAGLPLETHLADAGYGHGSRLQTLTNQISDDLSRGKSLPETIAEHGAGASRLLASAVAAGMRSGDLASSIELLGDLAADVAVLRRRILQSLAYPLTITAIAVVLFTLFVRTFLDRMRTVFADLRIPVSPYLQTALDLDHNNPYWPWIFPAVAIVVFLVWMLTGRAGAVTFGGPERLLLLFPGVKGMVRDLQFYTLTRMLGLLVERQVPLPDALLLAGGACGSRRLDHACRTAAGQISAGSLPKVSRSESWSAGKLPPLLQATLENTGRQEDRLRLRLAGVAGHYQRRLEISAMWFRSIIPVAMFVTIGAGTVVVYGLTVFWPITELYQRLGS
ncbi:MAG: type II secretion system F family protein [Planctomycetaceae bacterium]